MNNINRFLINVYKKLLTLAIALVIVTVVPLSFTKTADAAFSDCGSSRLCIWEHSNGGGARYEWGGGWQDTCANFIPSWYDRASSFKHNLSNGEWVMFYSQTNCTGWVTSVTYFPGNYGNFVGIENDQFRSVKFF